MKSHSVWLERPHLFAPTVLPLLAHVTADAKHQVILPQIEVAREKRLEVECQLLCSRRHGYPGVTPNSSREEGTSRTSRAFSSP